MFVAQKVLRVVDRNDKVTVFQAGDEVKGFESWPAVPQRAHLNLDWVREVHSVVSKPKAIKSKATKAAKAEKSLDHQGEDLDCPHCEKGFKTLRAAKIHTARAHKE